MLKDCLTLVKVGKARLSFEHEGNDKKYAYDKVIMLAGGVGFGTRRDAIKGTPTPGEKVVVMGGDNYRIGMGGGAVSSVETVSYAFTIRRKRRISYI